MNNSKNLLGLLIIVLVFVLVTYIVQSNIDFFKSIIGEGILGVLIYVFFVQLAIVFAPLNSTPLIPIASNVWGPFATSLINIFSWTLGSVIVFIISRKWGTKILGKLISLKDFHKLENKIPKENEFLSIVFLRMIVPVDILSYFLGLFSKIKFRTYLFASFIGIIPFAFAISYLGSIPFIYQLPVIFLVVLVIFIGLLIKESRKNS